MEADEKTCPQCAETVKAAAVICRHCGYSFTTGKMPLGQGSSTPELAPKKRSKLSIIGYVCLALFLIVFFASILSRNGGGTATTGGAFAPNSVASPDPTPTSVNEVEVTAREISAAFQENEAKAKLDYDGQPLVVSGMVKSIDLDFVDNPVIHLKGANDAMGMGISRSGKMSDVDISGLASADAAQIKKGQNLSFFCNGVTEVLGSAQLSNCKIVQVIK